MYAQHQQPYNGGSMQQRYGSQFSGGSSSGLSDGGGQPQYGRHGDPYGASADGPSGSFGRSGQGGQWDQSGPSGQMGQMEQRGHTGQMGQMGQMGQTGQMSPMGQSSQTGPMVQSSQTGPSASWSGSGNGGWQQQPQFQGERGQRMDGGFNQRTTDKDYDLISVLYHALQGVETCQRYCEDAQREGSPEVAQFMEQVQQQHQQIAQRAKELLFRQRQV